MKAVACANPLCARTCQAYATPFSLLLCATDILAVAERAWEADSMHSMLPHYDPEKPGSETINSFSPTKSGSGLANAGKQASDANEASKGANECVDGPDFRMP